MMPSNAPIQTIHESFRICMANQELVMSQVASSIPYSNVYIEDIPVGFMRGMDVETFQLIGERWPIEGQLGELELGFRGDLSYEALANLACIVGTFHLAIIDGTLAIYSFSNDGMPQPILDAFSNVRRMTTEETGLTWRCAEVRSESVTNIGVGTLWTRSRPQALTVPRIGWHAVDHDTTARQAKSRLCGVEIEVNGNGNFGEVKPKLGRWGVHYDGSCGWEVVSPPTPVSSIGRMWGPVIDAVKRAEKEVDNRCGLHVHVSAKGLKPWHVVRALELWEHCQALLFAICGQKRILSEYCAPVDLSAAIDEVGDAPEDIIEHIQGSRYSAVNVRNYREYDKVKNTIEFRAHRGTLDKDRILGWARLVVAIVDAAYGMSAKEYRSVMNERSQLRALVRIAPKSAEFILWRMRGYRSATTLNGAPRFLVVKRHMGISERGRGQRSGFRIQTEATDDNASLDELLAPLDGAPENMNREGARFSEADTVTVDGPCTDEAPCPTCQWTRAV